MDKYIFEWERDNRIRSMVHITITGPTDRKVSSTLSVPPGTPVPEIKRQLWKLARLVSRDYERRSED